jgi:hypothetical protein
MAKRDKTDDKIETKTEEKVEAKAAPAPAPAPTPNAPSVPEKPEPMLTFSRYFAHTGKPGHHKFGMEAWLKKRGGTSGRRTRAQWDALFKTY